MNDAERRSYLRKVLRALHHEIRQGTMALKTRVSKKKELRDLRHLLRAPADKYLFTDEKTYKRNVLGKGAPGFTHTVWSRKFMWQMATKQGSLAEQIAKQSPALVNKLKALLDGKNPGKRKLRVTTKTAIQNILSFLQFDKGVNAAFPPFHAKFLADTFLPKEGDCLVVDPCAGWGGRLLGTLCVNRAATVRYFGVDPEKRNKDAYENLVKRVQVYLKAEVKGPREADFSYRPFEDWTRSPKAKSMRGTVDLVLTSPPYFNAENYHTTNARQSANRYATYDEWREKFYRTLVQGAYELLKPGGVFVLNIADVASAKRLERDASILAREAGFESAGFYKLAMSVTPGTRGNERHTVIVDGVSFKHEPVFCLVKPARNSAVSRSLPISQRTIPVRTTKVVAPLPNPKNTKESLKQVFRRYKSSRRNPYALFSSRITAGLKDKTLRMCKVSGTIVAAFLASRRKVAGKGYLYAGTTPSVHTITKCAGDLDIDAISLVDESPTSQTALLRELNTVKGPAWAECVASDKVVSQLLCQAGFTYITSKIDALSDVLAIYFKGTAQARQQRTVAVGEAQIVNLKRLPVGHVMALVKKIAARLRTAHLNFTNHNSNYNKDDAWSALTLRGYLPDPTYIHDPDEARRGTSEKDLAELKRWEKRYATRHWGLQDTTLMKQFPEVQALLDTLVPGSSKNGNIAFKRVRLMRLKPQGGELTRHTDLTDGTLGLDDKHTVRIHFPIITNSKVILTSWDLHDQPIEQHFPAGECWYLNIRLPHKIVNGGTEDRVHIVVDLIANERIRVLIGGEQDRRVGQEAPENLLGNWTDPNPAPVIEEHSGFLVVRDDLLGVGSKIRFLDYLVKTAPEKEFVFGASNKVGYGAISLSYLCRKYRKKAVFFMAKTSNPTWHQKRVMELGGIIHFVPNGMLNVTKARAREYVAKDPKHRRLLPIGLEDQTVLASIVKVARSLTHKNKPVVPTEIWSVGSSGTLSRGLQAAFPNATVHVVQTGHSMSNAERGRANLHKSPYKFDQKCKEAEMPPYTSEPYYDSKVWSVVKKHGKKGALIWNVA